MIATIDVARYRADWTNNRHRAKRLLSEFIGTFGLLFVLSAGAAAMTTYAGAPVGKLTLIALLSLTSALWIVVAVYFLGDVSAHFNPAMTFAFALRGDIRWAMAVAYGVVQVVAAGVARSSRARSSARPATWRRRCHRPVMRGRRRRSRRSSPPDSR